MAEYVYRKMSDQEIRKAVEEVFRDNPGPPGFIYPLDRAAGDMLDEAIRKDALNYLENQQEWQKQKNRKTSLKQPWRSWRNPMERER